MTDVQQKTLKVPGAKLYHEIRGAGPLLVVIPGGVTDADTFAALATLLAVQYTVVTYDPRGNSRSTFDDIPVMQNLDTHGSDLAALIQSIAAGPAFIFGTSAGAQIGLNFAARYPSQLKRIVAHEPPCIALLPDAAQVTAQMRAVEKILMREGTLPAMNEFLRVTGMPSPNRPNEPAKEPPPRVISNMNYFLEFGVRPIGEYKPDIAKLRQRDVVVGAGKDSAGQLARRTAQALADQLDQPLVEFPLDHSSWARRPEEFSKTLLSALQNA